MCWLRLRRVKWSFQIARIAGIDVRIHATFLLLLAWIGFSHYASDGFAAMVGGLAFILLLFTCVVLHEFGHALAARAYGIRTPDITLLPIGGVARLERMPDNPWQELVVAMAGPAVNVVIAFGLFVVIGKFFGVDDLASVGEGRADLLASLFAVNVMLVVFNLVPAFPMDGGRILRALLAMRLKHARATRIAAAVGQAVAVIFALIGAFFGHPILLLIAVFVFFGAQQEATWASIKETVEDATVAQIMQPMPPVLHPGMTVLEAVRIAMRDARPAYPLVDSQLQLLGLVPAEALSSALGTGPTTPIDRLADAGIERFPADSSVARAWAMAAASARTFFPVVNAAGQLVGAISREDLAEFLRSAEGQLPARAAQAVRRNS